MSDAAAHVRPGAGGPHAAARTVLWQSRDTCRACARGDLATLVALGELPLANSLLEPGADGAEPRVPLTLALCEACTLVQLRETVAPHALFEHYAYFSSYATTTLQYADELAERLVRDCGLGAGSLVVEIGSNDGYLLAPLQARGVQVLGVEPARNVAAAARARGIPTESAFFGRTVAAELAGRGLCADVVLANNVLAHVADLPGFVAGIARLLRPHGRAVLEFPYLGDLLALGAFDTIYHEHLCYFSLRAVQAAFAGAGLHLVDVQRLDRHGGSLRTTFAAGAPDAPGAAAAELLRQEDAARLHDPASYAAFVAGIERTRRDLQAFLRAAAARGETVAAYGASAKGSTLMTVCDVGREQLAFVADRSPHKQGRLTPGNRVPIVAPERILEQQPDWLLLLSWNFRDEIVAQQAEYRRRGGRFVVPIPEVAAL